MDPVTPQLERVYLDLCRRWWLVDSRMSSREFERVQHKMGEAQIALVKHYKRTM